MAELTRPYAPHALLQVVYRTLFERIQVEEGWAERVQEIASKGSVLFVLPNLNWLDFLALDYLNKRSGLPPIRYANDLGLWLLNPDGPNSRAGGLINMLLPNRRHNPEKELKDALEHDGSAALFLKRPPTVLDVGRGASGSRGLREGDDLVRSIFRLAEESPRPIVLLPLLFLWSKSPNKLGGSPVDFVLGPRSFPTPTRAIGQFIANLSHASLRYGDPVDVREFLFQNREVSEEVKVRRITYMVLRRLERERRAMVGPLEKPPARVRSEILRSPKLTHLIADLAHGDPEQIREKSAEAAEMLSELQAEQMPNVVKGMGVALRWGFNKIYRGIEFNPDDVERIRDASRQGALLLLPSHKSHIDYLVLSYFFYERNLPVPLIAAGDNLNFQPIGPIFRRAGAFFIRRSFKGDRLYAAVVDAYIRRLIRDGFPIELFLEGGRSRTGKLLEPKFGLLNMIVDAAISVPQQTVHFVPISIGYERVIEADSYERELSGGEKKKEEAADLLKTREVLRHRYGRINLQFGSVMTLEDICGDLGISLGQLERPAKRRALVTRLGNRVMDEINRVTAVTPGALTACALLSDTRRNLSQRDVLLRAERLLAVLHRLGARVTAATLSPSGNVRASAIHEALQMFVDAELIDPSEPLGGDQGSGPIYTIRENRRLQLDTSKNIIVHFFVERGLVASAFDRDEQGSSLPTARGVLIERVLFASRLLKHEFRFRADASLEEIFDETLKQLLNEGHLAEHPNGLIPGPGENGQSGEEWLSTYRELLRNVFEAYWVTVKSLDLLLTTPLSDKDLIKHCLSLGHDYYLSEKIQRREATSKPLFQNACHALTELGYLTSAGGKWQLRESYQNRVALDELSLTLEGYLSGSHPPVP